MADPAGRPLAGAQRRDAVRLLRANRPFRLLWGSRAISFTGTSAGLLALVLYAAGSTGRGSAVALLLLAGDFAPTLLSPLTGTLTDRLSRTRLMTACELVSALIVALIAVLLPPLPLLLALVALRSTIGQIFAAASSGVVPDLVDRDDLEAANAALGVAGHGVELLGPLLVSLLLPYLQVRGLLLADAATFLLSGLLLLRLPSLPAALAAAERGSVLAEAREGLAYIWGHPALRALTLGFFAVVACTGVDDVALVFLARGPLGAGAAGASLLYAGSGAGLLLGFALLAGRGRGLPILALLVAGYALSSGGNLLTGLAWSIPAAFAMQLLRGVGLSLSDVANNSLLQRLVPARLLGRVFGNVYGAIGIAAALSYVAGGLLLDATDPRLVLVVAGLGGLAATAFVLLALPPALRQMEVPAGDAAGEHTRPA